MAKGFDRSTISTYPQAFLDIGHGKVAANRSQIRSDAHALTRSVAVLSTCVEALPLLTRVVFAYQ